MAAAGIARVVRLALGLGAFVLASLPGAARAQAVPPLEGREAAARHVWIDTGWDPTFTLGLGAGLALARPSPRQRVGIEASFRAPLVLLTRFDAWNLWLGATWAGWLRSGLGVVIGQHGSLRVDHDALGTRVGVGTTTSLRPGYYAPRWSAALDLAGTMVLATHIASSSVVGESYADRYPGRPSPGGPRDGWYVLTASRYRFGTALAARPFPRTALHLVGGLAYTPALDGAIANPPVAPLPFYVEGGGQLAW